MKREVKRSKAAASDATDEHHSERNSSYPGTSPLLTSVINELRKGVRHATLRASAAAYRVVLFLTRSIRSYPLSPYKVGILRWTDESQSKANESSPSTEMCSLSCARRKINILRRSPFPQARAGCRLRAISGLQPFMSRVSPVHTREEHVCANTELNHSLCGFEPDHNGRKPT